MIELGTFTTRLPRSRNKTKGKHWGYFEHVKKEFEQVGFFETMCLIKKTGISLRIKRASIYFNFVFPDRKRRDIDNFFSTYEVKGLIDGISKALGVDDSFDKLAIAINAEVRKGESCLEVTVFAEPCE